MPIVLLIIILDAALILLCNPTYYKFGLVVFRKTVKVNFPRESIPSVVEMEAYVPNSTWPNFVFKEISGASFAFRERMFSSVMSYTPVMHGILECDQERGFVRVSGRANLSTLAFLGYAIFGFSEERSNTIGFGFFAALIVLLIYLIQFSRYSQIAQSVTASWNQQGAVEAASSGQMTQAGIDYFTDRKVGNGLIILLIVAVMAAFSIMGSMSDPFRDLVREFKTNRSLPSDSFSPDQVHFHSRDMRTSRYKGSMAVNLSREGMEFEPTFPTKLFYSKVMIPTSEVTACSKTCSGNGKWDANLLIGKTSIQIDLEETKQVVDWCWDNKIPMATGKERREWLYSGVPLPDKSKYTAQLDSKEAYYYQARQSCLGY